MEQRKFKRLVREFPFLSTIISERNLSADSLGSIVVKRGDINLLEVTPNAWAHDLGEWGNDEGYRRFWLVNNDEVIQLELSLVRFVAPHGITNLKEESPIANQLLDLNRDVRFIVEVNQPSYDTSSWIEDSYHPYVVVYKMKDFNWRQSSLLSMIA